VAGKGGHAWTRPSSHRPFAPLRKQWRRIGRDWPGEHGLRRARSLASPRYLTLAKPTTFDDPKGAAARSDTRAGAIISRQRRSGPRCDPPPIDGLNHCCRKYMRSISPAQRLRPCPPWDMRLISASNRATDNCVHLGQEPFPPRHFPLPIHRSTCAEPPRMFFQKRALHYRCFCVRTDSPPPVTGWVNLTQDDKSKRSYFAAISGHCRQRNRNLELKSDSGRTVLLFHLFEVGE